jgi:hypothetical protein
MNITDITDRIKKDPLALAIAQMTDAMKFDYGRIFTSQIPNESALREFRRNLYVRLDAEGFKTTPEHIYPGYKLALAEHVKYCPNTNELVSCIQKARKQAKEAEKNSLEAISKTALPPPTSGTWNYEPELKKKLSKMMKDAIYQREVEWKDFTSEEKQHAKNRALDKHWELYGDKQKKSAAGHTCSSSFCGNPGKMSHGTVGNGNYYCKDHFTRNG